MTCYILHNIQVTEESANIENSITAVSTVSLPKYRLGLR